MSYRPGITAKLFVAIFAVTVTVVVLMTIAVQVSFRSDFLDYLRDRQVERVNGLAEQFADYYAEHGSWAELRQRQAWRPVPPGALRGPRREPWEDEDRRGHERERREHHRDRGGHDGHAGMPGVTLLDEARRPLIGPQSVPPGAELTPVEVDDEPVGWLAYVPAERLTDRLALRFQHEQVETAWWITGMGAALAAVISLLLARGFLAPVRRLATATRSLAGGHFDTRVNERRRDELGDLAADFNRLAETLERNERLRREVMTDISHELRTPVSILRAELEGMQDGVRAPTEEALARLQETVATLGKLIDDLYELSLADAGALDYRMEDIDLHALLETVIGRWRQHLEAAGLSLEYRPPRGRVTIRGDRRRLEQLWSNLLENSLRYTEPPGQVRFTLAREGGSVVTRIEDSAPAVPEEALSRIFERLYRVEASRSRASGGAGLGLAICRSIIEAHGGRIEAHQSPLGGLGIAVTLPGGDARGGAPG